MDLVQVNPIIVTIEKFHRGAKMWGEGANLMDRLLLILKEQASTTRHGVMKQALLLTNPTIMEVQCLVGRCLKIFLKC